MALVTIDANELVDVIRRAVAALTPRPTEWRSDWEREEQLLREMLRTVELVQSTPALGHWIAISPEELQMLRPFL